MALSVVLSVAPVVVELLLEGLFLPVFLVLRLVRLVRTPVRVRRIREPADVRADTCASAGEEVPAQAQSGGNRGAAMREVSESETKMLVRGFRRARRLRDAVAEDLRQGQDADWVARFNLWPRVEVAGTDRA